MTATAVPPAADRLHFTGDAEADRLLVSDPFALLMGFALDQQVTVQKAFSGPKELRRRLGYLDPPRIAGTDPEQLDRVFRERPALHRFPGAMAKRVQALAQAITDQYGGDAASVWRDARDGAELERRLLALPSIGEMKANSIMAILAKRLGVDLPGLAERLPRHPTLGDVDSDEALERYQEGKRAHKAAMRAAGKRP
jgi:uncharacterized HhH-GPD family protein